MEINTKNSIIERIQECFNLKNKTEIATFLGIKPQTLSNWITRNSIDYDIVFTKCVGVNLNWLMTGEGEKFLKDFDTPISLEILTPLNSDLSLQYDTPIIEKEVGVDYITKTRIEFGQGFNEDYKGIPLLPLKAAAGVLSGYVDQMTKYDCDYYLVPEFKDADFLIKINGDSMQPRYLSGDIVACRTLPMDTFFQWNATYAINSEQGILIKRIKKANEDDSITLVSDNKDYEPFDLRKSQIHGLGKVIGLIRLDD